MKKFIIATVVIFALALAGAYLYFYEGWGGDLFSKDGDVHTFTATEGRTILVDQGNGLKEFEIRGVDLGAGKPGHFATDYALDKETYLRWFAQIQDMGANTIRVYTLLGDAFYEALYEYNHDNPHPLYLIHGVWLNDYAGYSHMDGFDADYQGKLESDTRTVIDAIHGQRMVELGRVAGTGSYRWDVSPWVLGYIVGVEWEPSTVAYTDMKYPDRRGFSGRYLYTTDDATPFETMLAELGDSIISYESRRYGEQRLLAFSNWPSTDPFTYSEVVQDLFDKFASVDVEHIVATDEARGGMFASYHVYPYFPDYGRYVEELSGVVDDTGQVNTYYAYLRSLVEHHSMPVVIAEFGIPAARGVAQQDHNTGRNQGHANEQDQADGIVRNYHDIMLAGCAGSIVFEWQDEWFKRTWNTVYATDQLKSPLWSDWQTNEQFFGLLAFDPGEERSVSYVDGDLEEWTDADVVSEEGGLATSVKYDEKFLYLMVRTTDGSALGPEVYLPLDVTPKSGASGTAADVLTSWSPVINEETGTMRPTDRKVDTLPRLSFDRDADFVAALRREGESRVVVQERYECLRAMMMWRIGLIDPYAEPPAADSQTFRTIELALRTARTASEHGVATTVGLYDERTFETGLLREGDANPAHDGYDSLADYCFGNDFVEVRLPWQLINFSNPAEMQVHDDYYQQYGVENLAIESIYVGTAVGDGPASVKLAEVPLAGWGTKPAYHERLKLSYYALQDVWTSADPAAAAARSVAAAQAHGSAEQDGEGQKATAHEPVPETPAAPEEAVQGEASQAQGASEP